MKIQHLNQWYPVFSDDQYCDTIPENQRVFADDYYDDYLVKFGNISESYWTTSQEQAFNDFNEDWFYGELTITKIIE